MTQERADPWFCKLIETAVQIDRWTDACRAYPDVAGPLGRAVERKRTAATEALGEWMLSPACAEFRVMERLADAHQPPEGSVRIAMPPLGLGGAGTDGDKGGEAADSNSVLRRLGLRL